MKRCTKCNSKKAEAEFSKNPKSRDKLQRWCRKCVSIYKHDNQYKRKEYNYNYERTPKRRKKMRERQEKRRQINCKKEKARQILQSAVRRGKVSKPDICNECKKQFELKDIEGHHEDYDKPLEVEWLCAECHSKLHPKEALYAFV